jgi:ABC-type amino acid transport substrate-binding protein
MMKKNTTTTLLVGAASLVLLVGCAPKIINVRTFPSTKDAIVELKTGTVNAVVGDFAVMAYEARESTGQLEVSGSQFATETIGIGLAKEAPELKAALTDALRKIMEDKTYSRTLVTWAVAAGKVDPPPAPESVPEASAVPQLADGDLKVGLELRYPPMEFFDKEFNKPAGVDVELAEGLVRELGVEVVFEDMPFDQLVEAAATGKVDIVLSTMAVTDERSQRIDFIPYLSMGSGILVQTGNPSAINALPDLCGRTVGIQEGMAQLEIIKAQTCE